jgi:hypothetical protein
MAESVRKVQEHDRGQTFRPSTKLKWLQMFELAEVENPYDS